jgi:hypothetical protein
MNTQNWNIYDKRGSPMNWAPDPYIPLVFTSNTGVGAVGYLISDTSGNIIDAEITNGGLYYTALDTVSYTYQLGDPGNFTSVDILIGDVSVFNPEPTNATTIIGLDNIAVDASAFIYPSISFAGAIFLNPVSLGLIETENLFILEKTIDDKYIRPYDLDNPIVVFRMIGDETQISFFTVNENSNEITWTNELIFDLSQYAEGIPLSINIGFRSDDEGVFEQTIRIYHQVGDTLYTMADIVVNAEAIGEDERFRTLLSNFGAPDPKNFPSLFKEVDINESLPDWQVVNQKSKHMILEYDQIIPYIGTYKALINALKWLGYDDIYVREWFRDVKEKTKVSYIVPFDAKDRLQTILMFDLDKRKTLKKLNQLSLVYCLTRETGEIDEWGTPLTENCYSYSINEVFVKLLALKHWLEKNIIGVNCRIIDISGEGIYFERVQNLIYGTDDIGHIYEVEHSLTPYSPDHDSELKYGDASIRLTFLELTNNVVGDMPFRFKDMIYQAWNPYDSSSYIIDPCTGVPTYKYVDINSAEYLADPSSFVLIGPNFQYPFVNFSDIMWRLSVEKTNAGVLEENLVTNPLFIYENDIRFYNIFDVSSIFYDVSTHLTIQLEKAFLRNPSIDEWEESIEYSIYPGNELVLNPSDSKMILSSGFYTIITGRGKIQKNSSIDNYLVTYNPISFYVDTSAFVTAEVYTIINTNYASNYIMESSTGQLITFDGYATFVPDVNSRLQYAYDANFRVPLLSMLNYKFTDEYGITHNFNGKEYYLDIIDGKIAMDAGSFTDTSDNVYYYLNWNYDTSLDEQKITINVVYQSPRLILFQTDPSTYFWADPCTLTGGNDPSTMIFDNSIYTMKVNHTGDYHIELFAWDEYNTMFYNPAKKLYNVWTKRPTIHVLVDNPRLLGYEVSTYMTQYDAYLLTLENLRPIYDKYIPLQDLSVEKDYNGNVYISVPSITYFQDVPESNSINRFFNMTERLIGFNNNSADACINIDQDYQRFYTGDQIRLVHFNLGEYDILKEISANITYAESGNEIINVAIDVSLPSSFVINGSNGIYALNDTYRNTYNITNSSLNKLQLEIEGYQFQVGQIVGIIVTDSSMPGYEWGASYKVINTDGSIHTFDNLLPTFLLDNKYIIKAKHAFSSYSDFNTKTLTAVEVESSMGNIFNVWLKDSYCHEYYLDNTFVFMNILFDHDKINYLWYDPSSDRIADKFYYYPEYVIIDTSTFIILKADYDPVNYMLNQKNIWTVRTHDTNEIYFRVFNKSVPIVFDPSGNYTLEVESYDSHGNLIKSE